MSTGDTETDIGIRVAERVKSTEQLAKPRMMRWDDDGGPATLYIEGSSELSRDRFTGVLREKRQEIAPTPHFTENILPNTIISFGPRQDFLVVEPKFQHPRESHPDDVFVQRVAIDDPKIQERIRSGDLKLLQLDELPLTQSTRSQLSQTNKA